MLPTPPSGRGLTAAQQGRRRVAQRARRGRATSRRRRSRSRPRSRTTCTARRRASTCRASSSRTRSTVRRRSCAARSCPGLLQVAHRNVVARPHRPRAVRDGHRVPARARRRVRHRRRAAARRATGCRDPRRARRVDPAAAPPRRRAARRATPSPKQPGRPAVAAGPRRRARRRPRDRRRRRRRRSTSPRASAPRCTRVAPRVLVGRRAPTVGYVGELLPAVAEAADLPGRVIVAELDLDLLLVARGRAGRRGVAVGLPGGDAGRLARRAARTCRPATCARRSSRAPASCSSRCASSTTTAAQGVPEGAKSLTFALRFRAADRTLTAAEATEAKLAGVARRGRALRRDAARVVAPRLGDVAVALPAASGMPSPGARLVGWSA